MPIFLRPLIYCLWQNRCPLCDRITPRTFCRDCQQQLQDTRCNTTQFERLGLPLWAWGDYGGPLKRAIAQCKYHQQPEIALYLGECLGHLWASQGQQYPDPLLVPIPMHPDKQKQRGFNQAEVIAQGFARHRGQVAKVLQRVKATTAQHSLGPTARRHNLQDAFQLATPPYWGQRPLVIVDDIYTTGATVAEALRPLRATQAHILGIAVVAIAPGSN